MVITCDEISFTIFAEWPDCDVDLALTESGSPFQPNRTADTRTPTCTSVGAMLDALGCDELLAERKIEIDEWCGLMMGCCHITFQVDAALLPAELSQLIEFTKERVRVLIAEHVRYHQEGDEVQRSSVAIVG